MVTIEISDSMAAAIRQRANQIMRRDKCDEPSNMDEALAIVLNSAPQFQKIHNELAGVWPSDKKQ